MPSFKPDYRDVILYNGIKTFRATGNFYSTIMEMIDANGSIVYFNVNVDCSTYVEHHQNYEIFRNANGKDFSDMGVKFLKGWYFPTGRRFTNGGKRFWEIMAVNDTTDVMYIALPFTDKGFIIGAKAL